MNIELLSYLFGAGSTLVAMIAGRLLLTRRKVLAQVLPSKPEHTCGCGHDFALHDIEGNGCHGEVRRPHYRSHGGRSGYEYVACPCRKYVGSKPVEDIDVLAWQPPKSLKEGS